MRREARRTVAACAAGRDDAADDDGDAADDDGDAADDDGDADADAVSAPLAGARRAREPRACAAAAGCVRQHAASALSPRAQSSPSSSSLSATRRRTLVASVRALGALLPSRAADDAPADAPATRPPMMHVIADEEPADGEGSADGEAPADASADGPRRSRFALGAAHDAADGGARRAVLGRARGALGGADRELSREVRRALRAFAVARARARAAARGGRARRVRARLLDLRESSVGSSVWERAGRADEADDGAPAVCDARARTAARSRPR